MKIKLLVIIALAANMNVFSQTFDIIPNNNGMDAHLSGQINSGQSETGSARLSLHRSHDSKEALIKWNLNNATNLYEAPEPSDDQDHWQVGIWSDDNFKISRYKQRFYDITGKIIENTDAIVIKDDYDGNTAEAEPRIVFPAGVIQIGPSVQLIDLDNDNLGFTGSNFLPAQQCGNNNLGSAYYAREWNNVVAQAIVESDCRIPPGFAKINYKSNTSGLDKILKINTYRYTAQKSDGTNKLLIDPYELIKIVPEAVHSREMITDSKGQKVYVQLDNYGMKYNQLIPVLVNAIKEQQIQIENIKAEILKIKEMANR